MTRLTQIFARTRQENRAALVTYIMAGDPDQTKTAALLAALPAAGADIIELGMPFSDPMADGATIQAAAIRALRHGASLRSTLALVKDFRQNNSTTPIVLMGYANPILAYGVTEFYRDAAKAGIDGVLLVDLPPEEDAEWRQLATQNGIATIRLATPTTDAARLPAVLDGAGGFLYYVAIAGVTGTVAADQRLVIEALQNIRSQTDLPLAVGFGIKTPAQAKAFAAHADAIVVGSAIIDRIQAALDEKGNAKAGLVEQVCEFVTELRRAAEKI
jgi:tryptophan synthase alpha chain